MKSKELYYTYQDEWGADEWIEFIEPILKVSIDSISDHNDLVMFITKKIDGLNIDKQVAFSTSHDACFDSNCIHIYSDMIDTIVEYFSKKYPKIGKKKEGLISFYKQNLDYREIDIEHLESYKAIKDYYQDIVPDEILVDIVMHIARQCGLEEELASKITNKPKYFKNHG